MSSRGTPVRATPTSAADRRLVTTLLSELDLPASQAHTFAALLKPGGVLHPSSDAGPSKLATQNLQRKLAKRVRGGADAQRRWISQCDTVLAAG
jgi:hypothetical protein